MNSLASWFWIRNSYLLIHGSAVPQLIFIDPEHQCQLSRDLFGEIAPAHVSSAVPLEGLPLERVERLVGPSRGRVASLDQIMPSSKLYKIWDSPITWEVRLSIKMIYSFFLRSEGIIHFLNPQGTSFCLPPSTVQLMTIFDFKKQSIKKRSAFEQVQLQMVKPFYFRSKAEASQFVLWGHRPLQWLTLPEQGIQCTGKCDKTDICSRLTYLLLMMQAKCIALGFYFLT